MTTTKKDPEVVNTKKKKEPEVVNTKKEPEVVNMKKEPEVVNTKKEPEVTHDLWLLTLTRKRPSLTTSHYILFDKYFSPHAGEIWTKSYAPTYTKFWSFWHHFGRRFRN